MGTEKSNAFIDELAKPMRQKKMLPEMFIFKFIHAAGHQNKNAKIDRTMKNSPQLIEMVSDYYQKNISSV